MQIVILHISEPLLLMTRVSTELRNCVHIKKAALYREQLFPSISDHVEMPESVHDE